MKVPLTWSNYSISPSIGPCPSSSRTPPPIDKSWCNFILPSPISEQLICVDSCKNHVQQGASVGNTVSLTSLSPFACSRGTGSLVLLWNLSKLKQRYFSLNNSICWRLCSLLCLPCYTPHPSSRRACSMPSRRTSHLWISSPWRRRRSYPPLLSWVCWE